MIPFTREAFFGVFTSYNQSNWPAQVLLVAAALVVLFVPRLRASFLSGLWVWCAIAYFWAEFTKISGAGWLFGAMFLIGAFIVFDDSAAAESVSRLRRAIGGAFIIYAVVLYPLIGYFAGQRYPAMPTFGAPCPIVIFTIGLLIATRRRPVLTAVVPLLWSVIATSATLAFGVVEDLGLPVAAVTLIAFDIREIIHERHRMLHA